MKQVFLKCDGPKADYTGKVYEICSFPSLHLSLPALSQPVEIILMSQIMAKTIPEI